MLYLIYIFLFSMSLSQETYGAGIQDFIGNGGGYEIHCDKIGDFSAIILDSTTPAAIEFKEVIERSYRSYIPPETYTPKPDFWGIFNDIREKNGAPRDASAARAAILNSSSLTYEDQLQIAASFLTPEEKDKFLEQTTQLQDNARDQHLKNYHLYKEKYDVLGEWRLSTLRNFINKKLLKITGIQERIDGDEILFDLMKRERLITTNIATLDGYTYSQRIAASEFLQNHPEIHILVLGCGSFIPYQLAVPFLGREEGGCGMCKKAHHLSKGEMTMSLPDPSHHHFDLNNGYNEEGSASDIVGDLRSPEFWKGILEGLGTRKLNLIQDHTYYGIAITSECLGYIHQCLANDGIFEIFGPELNDLAFSQLGQYFTLSAREQENELHLYKFMKNI